MDLTLTTSCSHWSPLANFITLFCVVWPFIAIAMIAKRKQSPAPLIAMLLPLAVTLFGAWSGTYDTLAGTAIARVSMSASQAAGYAEALRTFGFGALTALAVAVLALVRRHRPVMDLVTIVIAAFFIADTIALLLYQRFLTMRIADLLFVGLGIAIVIAIATAVWLVLVARGVVHPRPLLFATPAIALCMLVLAVVVWQQERKYLDIAMHGIRARQ